MPPFSNYIKNNFSGSLSLKVFIPKATFLYGSLFFIFYLLDGKKNASESLAAAVPLSLKFGANFHLFKYLEIDTSIGGGISILAGYVFKPVAYVRPNLLFDLHFFFVPVKYFKIGIGFNAIITFMAYENWMLICLAPAFSIAVSF